MKQAILTIISLLALSVFSPMFSSGTVYAAACGNTGAKGEVLKGLNATGNDCDAGGVNRLANTIVNIISYLAGIVGIIMIIISGFKYITSGGDSNKIASAKTTLIYALVGLAVAVLAQVLVNVVLSETNDAINPSAKP